MSIYITEPQEQARACVIWLHGLGANASDMMSVANQLMINTVPLRHVFIDAPSRPVTLNGGLVMPAWYDIYGMQLVDREDQQGIEQSELIIRQVIEEQVSNGYALDRIFLAGFSQGGAMALHTALQSSGLIGGVIVLSGYLPLADRTGATVDTSTPFFIASGLFDPIVLPQWTIASKEWLFSKGYEQVSYHQYPMEHSICLEEINDLSLWINKLVEERDL